MIDDRAEAGPINVSRRDFVKLSGAAGVGLGLGLRPEGVKAKETEAIGVGEFRGYFFPGLLDKFAVGVPDTTPDSVEAAKQIVRGDAVYVFPPDHKFIANVDGGSRNVVIQVKSVDNATPVAGGSQEYAHRGIAGYLNKLGGDINISAAFLNEPELPQQINEIRLSPEAAAKEWGKLCQQVLPQYANLDVIFGNTLVGYGPLEQGGWMDQTLERIAKMAKKDSRISLPKAIGVHTYARGNSPEDVDRDIDRIEEFGWRTRKRFGHKPVIVVTEFGVFANEQTKAEEMNQTGKKLIKAIYNSPFIRAAFLFANSPWGSEMSRLVDSREIEGKKEYFLTDFGRALAGVFQSLFPQERSRHQIDFK